MSYDGSEFYGMQIQPDKITVEGTISNALKKLNIKTKITHSGRTDRGVHALNQVISFEIPNFWNLEKLKNILNKILYPSIYFKKITIAPFDFHPRFSAKKRSYRYLISKYFTPFNAKYTHYYSKKIDIKKINNALGNLIGKHDFEYFAKTGSDVNNYIREIYKAYAFEYKNVYVIKIEGNGFLRGQIRIIINFLLQINENKLTINDLKKQLNKEKLISKHLAAPNGLYLERIWY
nr:tRNA pseudouridine(38-40) synthase TruA [Lebetimonas natsushimae]